MIRNEGTYYIGYHKNVRELGALPAVTFDTIAGLLRAQGGIGEISNQTLCDILGITDKGLRGIISKLIEYGYIDKVQGNGRGKNSTYIITKKGEQSSVFLQEKGGTKFQKRGNKVPLKGEQSSPINKELNKELNKESGGVLRETQHPTLSDTTPQKNLNMEKFNLFWKLYCGDANWENEKENCERVWFGLPQEWQDELVRQLQAGTRWRVRENDNPYWYLRNYNGEKVNRELPYIRQGSAAFDRWREKNIKEGKAMCLIRFEEKVAVCLKEDLPTMVDAGAHVFNMDWK